MKIKNLLYVLLFIAFAMACTPDNGDIDNPGGGDTEEPSTPSNPDQPTEPDEPAAIKFGSNYAVADYNGGVVSVVVNVKPDWEWDITTSGEEWFSAERNSCAIHPRQRDYPPLPQVGGVDRHKKPPTLHRVGGFCWWG